MQKCATCQYYDRKHAKAAGANLGAAQQGQCRRMAPMLSPLNSKSYLIEGVWPTVRDDDWCGEWKLVARRGEARAVEASAAGVVGLQPSVPHVARIGANVGTEPMHLRHSATVLTAPVRSFMPSSGVAGGATSNAAEPTAAAVPGGD